METDPGRLPLIVQLLIIVVLTYINAFFAKAEMAFVSLSKAKLKAIADDTTDGDARAERVMLMLDDTNSFLSTIQVAITLAGFLSSAFASFNLSELIVKLFAGWGVNLNPQLSVVIITLLLSYLTLVFGELFPKRLALRDPEKIAMQSVGTIVFAQKFFTPFVKLLSASVQGLLKLFGLDKEEESNEYMAEEIMNLLEEGQEQGEIDESGKDMINAVFEFDDVFAYEIMTPRTDVYMVDINEPVGSYVDEMLEERYARIPFYGEDIDDIIGILYIKDYILEARRCGFENVDIRSILKKPYFVPENKKINELLDEMQQDKQSMAVLIDEYEDDEPQLIKKDDHTYVIDGLYTLDDLEEETGIALTSESDNSATVGGFVMELSGEVPDERGSIGKEFTFENYRFRILAVKERRIERVKLTVMENDPANGDEAE